MPRQLPAVVLAPLVIFSLIPQAHALIIYTDGSGLTALWVVLAAVGVLLAMLRFALWRRRRIEIQQGQRLPALATDTRERGQGIPAEKEMVSTSTVDVNSPSPLPAAVIHEPPNAEARLPTFNPV